MDARGPRRSDIGVGTQRGFLGREIPPPLGRRRLTAAASATGLVVSYLTARRRPLPPVELDLTAAINDAPDAVAVALWPIMQVGNVFGPVLVAGAIAVCVRRWEFPAAIVVVGTITWSVAKLIKDQVERDRPATYLPDIVVREGDGGGFGYLSGHSAVAAATAIMVMSLLPPRWRPVPVMVAFLVGNARIVYGVHLPADVVGGWSLGALCGLAGLWLTERIVEASS